MTRQQAIDKVTKLAEITIERGATEEEEKTAMRLGRKLIERFELQLSDFVAPEPEPPPPVFRPHPFANAPFGTTQQTFYGNGIRVVIRFE